MVEGNGRGYREIVEKTDNIILKVSMCKYADVSKGQVVSLRQGDFYIVCKQEDILYVVAAGSYTFITMLNQQQITVTFNLAEVESKLTGGQFIRIHRSVIVNISHITKFAGNTLYVGRKNFPIGRKFREAFINRMNIVCGGTWGGCLK